VTLASANVAEYDASKSLSTLATIVAENVDCRRKVRQSPFSATVWTGLKLDLSVRKRLGWIITSSCVLQCSRTCEDGVQMRHVACQDDLGTSSADCNPRDRPSDNRTCNMGPCPRWNHGDWAAVNHYSHSILAYLCLLIY